MCLGCMHPYPAGHWMYSLYDLLDNSVFVVCFFVDWPLESPDNQYHLNK